MICGAYNKSKKCPCTAPAQEKYGGKCGNHRDRVNKNLSSIFSDMKIEEKPEKDCPVCGDDCNKQSCVDFECGHFLCVDCCIENDVTGMSDRCPMCRADIKVASVTGISFNNFSDYLTEMLSEREQKFMYAIDIIEKQVYDIVSVFRVGDDNVVEIPHGEIEECVRFLLMENEKNKNNLFNLIYRIQTGLVAGIKKDVFMA